MARLNKVFKNQIKACSKCGQPITFVKNRNDKNFAVDVVEHPSGGFCYRSGIGAYNNLTPWHTCKDIEKELQDREAERIKLAKDRLAIDWFPRLVQMANDYVQGLKTKEDVEALSREYVKVINNIT